MFKRILLSILFTILMVFNTYGVQYMPSSQINNNSTVSGAFLNDVLKNVSSNSTTQISNETSRATDVETNLQNQITSETSRATVTESNLQSQISSPDIARISQTNNFTIRPQVNGTGVMLQGEVAPAAFSNITGNIYDNQSASNELIRINNNINNVSNTVSQLPTNDWNSVTNWLNVNINNIAYLIGTNNFLNRIQVNGTKCITCR